MRPASLFHHHARHLCLSAMGLCLAASAMSGCSSLLPADIPPATLYAFDDAKTRQQPPRQTRPGAPNVLLSPLRAAAGYDSAQMIYVKQRHQLDYFRQNQWANTPALMLTPMVIDALEDSGLFNAVIRSPSSATAQYRLDLEIRRLQQEFFNVPAQVHFTLRAHLSDMQTHQVVAWQEFDVLVPSNSEDPYGGVLATNKAIRQVLTELNTFCAAAIQTSANSTQTQRK